MLKTMPAAALALGALALGLAFPWLKTSLVIALGYGFAALGVVTADRKLTHLRP